jgi:hypothetical protein
VGEVIPRRAHRGGAAGVQQWRDEQKGTSSTPHPSSPRHTAPRSDELDGGPEPYVRQSHNAFDDGTKGGGPPGRAAPSRGLEVTMHSTMAQRAVPSRGLEVVHQWCGSGGSGAGIRAAESGPCTGPCGGGEVLADLVLRCVGGRRGQRVHGLGWWRREALGPADTCCSWADVKS